MYRLTDEPRTMSTCMSVDECRRYNRLWEYENTGLTPDEIAAIQAERDAALRRAEAAVREIESMLMDTCDTSRCVNMRCHLDQASCNPIWRGPEPGGEVEG